MRKRLMILFAVMFTAVCANAQIMRAEELEKYAMERYGDKWTEAATNLASQITLDRNRALTYVQVMDCGEMTKDQIYVMLNYWFTATFNDGHASINLNDKELGVIIAEGFVSNVAVHYGGMNAYTVSLRPVIKIDIKDKKIRVTYTIQYYDVAIGVGEGIIGILADDEDDKKETEITFEKWAIDSCFPFVTKDTHGAKRTSSKALIMAHAYSNVMMDKIEEVVKNGIIGNENDDW